MEIVLAIATLLGGVTAVWFFVDKYNEKKQLKNYIEPLTSNPPSNSKKPELDSKIFGAVESGRHPFFIDEPQTDLNKAISSAKASKKLIFAVIYNPSHPTKSKLMYSLGCFMDYFTTKQLVEDHFITALIPSTQSNIKKFIPEDDPLENCRWIVMSPNQDVLKSEGVYANPDEGLKRVRAIIKQNV